MSVALDFLRFRCGAGDLLVPLESVVEVLPMVELRHRDGSPDPRWAGLLEYRGGVVPVHALGAGDRDGRDRPDWHVLVVRVGDALQAWIADDVPGVVAVPPALVRRLPAGAGPGLEVAQVEGEVLRVLRPGDPLP